MRFTSIRYKLIASAVLTVLIPMAMSGYGAITKTAHAVTPLSKSNGQFIAAGTALQVAATLEGELKLSAAFASRTQVKIAAEAVSAKEIGDAGEAVQVQGISEFTPDTSTLWSCIKYADVALYRAKEEGRNTSVRFTKDMWQEEQV